MLPFDAEAEDFGPPQVHPGTVLRVEEGQECAVLCAAEEAEGRCSSPAGWRSVSTACRSAGSGAAARDCPIAAAAPPPTRALWPGSASATATGGAAAAAATGSGAAAVANTPAGGGDGYETEYGDTATATGGDVSSGDDETETFSELSEPGGTEVVYVREGVAVVPAAAAASHLWWSPAPSRAAPAAARQRILGRLSLVKQYGVLFMAWLPYSRGVLQQDGTFRVVAPTPAKTAPPGKKAAAAAKAAAKEESAAAGSAAAVSAAGSVEAAAAVTGAARGGGADGTATGSRGGAGGGTIGAAAGRESYGYAVHPIPLSEVAALRRRLPPLGLGPPSLTVVLRSGVTLPPLHFTRGGLRQLIAAVQQHTLLLKSATEPHTYLVNDTADPLCRSLTALELSDVLIGGPPPGASATFEPGGGAVAATGTARAAAAAAAATAAASPLSPPPPAAAVTATWISSAVGLGLVATAAAPGGDSGGGGGGAAVSWSWADAPAALQAGISGVRGRGGGGGSAADDGDGRSSASSDGGGAHRGGGGGGAAWAYGIFDAINRFVENVRGTASGWISAFDELEEAERSMYGTCGDGGGGGGDGGGADDDDADAEGSVGYEDAVDVDVEVEAEAETPAEVAAAAAAIAERGRAERDGCSTGSAPPHAAPHGDRTATGAAAAVGAAASGGGRPSAGPRCDAAVATEVGDFELLDGGGCQGEAASYAAGRRRPRPPPLSPEEWAAMFDAEGRLVSEGALRERVFSSGCSSELRREVWKHLLGMFPRGSTAAERAARAQAWQSDYLRLRAQWQSLLPGQEARCGHWRAARSAVDKDVRRTDRQQPLFAAEGGAGLRALRNVLLTHVRYDEDLGYCQGMSDVASPLLAVMRDEAEAFWAFAALMERQRANFAPDLAGMTCQLAALRRLVQLLDPPLYAYLERRDCLSCYFAFRWLLLSFKREFKYDEVLQLWEACWACGSTRHLHIYLAVAVLVQHRRLILSSDLDFDGLLRLAVGLSGRLQLRPLLDTAEALVRYAGEAGREATAELP